MRILSILPKLPGDPVDGHVIRSRPFHRRLVERAEVDILSYDVGTIDEDIEAGASSCQVVAARLHRNASLLHRMRTFFSPEDVQQRDSEFSEALKDKLLSQDYDIVWVAGWRMLLYLPEIREHASGRTKIIADVVDDETLRNWSDFRSARGLKSNATMSRRLLRNSLYQRRFLSEADLALFVAETDAESTRKRLPGLRVEVNQNGVDTNYFAPAPCCRAEGLAEGVAKGVPGEVCGAAAGGNQEPILLFEGTMSYAPNIEGAKYLVHEILPLVKQSVPGVRVVIVGRNPTPEIRALACDDVEVTGTVDDIRVHMRRGALLACSLRSGSGLKNKILQSWAMGVPVVATPISVPGLGGIDGENLLLAEGPEAFAAQCVKLLQSPELSKRIAQAGRELAVERYSIQVKLDQIDGFIDELVR